MTEFTTIIEPLAKALLGEPNPKLSSKNELRYGARGSLSVDLQHATWFDHETNTGGGVLDLVTRETKLDGAERMRWMEENGFKLDDAARSNGKTAPHIVAAYPYVDETGRLLFEVVRLDPKDFRQRQPDKTEPSGWRWSTKGVRQVPYRLPEVIEAKSNGNVIAIVEGEKDVNLLWSLNIPATCNAGGAGKWHPSLTPFFEGADVVIIPDHDPQKRHPKTGEPMVHDDGRPVLPGQDHARDVAQALVGVAERVRVLDLAQHWPAMPLKGDVSDWLHSGGGNADALYALIERLPTWSPEQPLDAPPTDPLLDLVNVRAWQGKSPKATGWVVRERIPDVNVTLLTGQGGVGKTLLMQQLSVATVLGKEWVNELPEMGPVLFVTAEDDENELHFRYDKIARHYDTTFDDLADAGLNLMTLAGKDAVMAIADARGIVKPTELFKTLVRTAREIRPRWIGLDTAADIFIVNERDRSQVRQCISLLRGISLELSTAVILLAHPSLAGISSGSGLSGSTAWNNSVRSRLYLKTEKTKDKDDEEGGDDSPEPGSVRILETMKSNYAALGIPTRLVWRDGLLVPDRIVAKSAPEKAALDRLTRETFLTILRRFNAADRAVSDRTQANNFAPKVFADEPDSKKLALSKDTRKKLLATAMKALFSDSKLTLLPGPQGVPASKRNQCIYEAGDDLPLLGGKAR